MVRRGVDPDQPADQPPARETPADRVARIRAAVAASRGAAPTSPPALVVQATVLSTRQMGQMVEVMERHGVEYVVIGGSAVAAHDPAAMPTQDLDTVVRRTDENLTRAAAALEELRAVLLHPDGTTSAFPRPFTRDLFTPFLGGTVTTMTDQGQLDLAFTIHAFPRGYDDVIALTSRRELGGSTATVADLDVVVRSKEAANRPKDREVTGRLRERFALGPRAS